MFQKFFLWVLLAIVCSTAIKVLLMLDLNKRLYSHVPGPCKVVAGPTNGALDIELLEDGTAFITSGLVDFNTADKGHVFGKIFLYKFSRPANHKALELKIDAHDLDRDTFNPMGISSYVSKGRITLYVVNKGENGDSIECFLFSKEKRSLTHTKTIKDPLIHSAKSLLVVGADRFFLSNSHYFSNRWLQKIEILFMMNLGSLVFYDGKQATVSDSWLPVPTGIGKDPKNKYLYVSLLAQESIRIYNLTADMKVMKHADMNLMTSPENLYVEPKTGELWLGTHMVIHQLMQHMQKPHLHVTPSQVLHIRIQDGHDSWVITEPYSNDGNTLSGSSSAVVYSYEINTGNQQQPTQKQQQLLIGTMHHKLMLCDILNPDYA